MINPILSNIPTNIITGFLGAGKTTVIKHLLRTKPPEEKWAVLVNEFGEVGIDGAILAAEGLASGEIAVKEVAGGCMCCAVGLPSKVALNKLIREHRPDRILIEPTGLAQPQQILQLFGGSEYANLLQMQSMVCLLDPWSVTQERFTALPAFLSQVELADVLVLAKADVASPDEVRAFEIFCAPWRSTKHQIAAIEHGSLPWQWLCADHKMSDVTLTSEWVQHRLAPKQPSTTLDTADNSAPVLQLQRFENQAEHGFSCGWRFPTDWQFDEDRLMVFLQSLEVPRVKGVVRGRESWYVFNRMRNTVSVESLGDDERNNIPLEGRIEMIDLQAADWEEIEARLLACRAS